jgi:hypothetical protein
MNGFFLNIKLSCVLLIVLGNMALAGPPEPPPMSETGTKSNRESPKTNTLETAEKLSEIARKKADSLLQEASKLKITIDLESLQESDFNNLKRPQDIFGRAKEKLDTTGLPSFKEIIIDENGIIKVRTDTGLITYNEMLFDSSLLYDIPFYDSSGRNQITRWGENIIVDRDTRVNSDIQVVRANVTVKGVVNGDVTTVGGDIYVTSTGVINGNAVAVGGKIKKDEGARITGAIMQLKLPLMNVNRGSSSYRLALGILLLIVLLGLLFAWLMVALVPVPMNRIAQELSKKPFKSFLFGYIFYIGLPIAWLLLLITILGIPIALLVIPLAFPLVVVQAYASINIAVGQRLFKKTNTLQAFMFGGLVTTAIPLLIMIIGYALNSLPLFVINMIFLGFFLFLFVPFGLGAALNTRFGFYRKDKKPETVSAQVNI